MKRRWYVVLGAVGLGVFANQHFFTADPVLSLPPAAAGWTVNPGQKCDKPVPAALHLWRGTDGAQSVCRGDYAGSPPLKLTLYYMPNQFAGASDAAQKWQSRPHMMSFFRGSYFGVVESVNADPLVLERFVLAVEAALPPGDEWHH
jgi:hypothetical protein